MGKRSIWKGPYVHPKLLKKVDKMLDSGRIGVVKTWSRNSVILPNFVDLTFSVYNGKKFISFLVKEQMVGKKLGEFSPTRTFTGHKKDKK